MKSSAFVRVGGSLLVFVGALVFLGYMARVYSQAEAVRQWPTAQGEILKTWVSVRSDSEDDEYVPEVRYRYTVEGQTYTGDRLRAAPVSAGSRNGAERMLAAYPQGAVVRVYYNPQNPAESVLEPGVARSFWFFLAGGVAWVFVGLYVTFQAVREASQNR